MGGCIQPLVVLVAVAPTHLLGVVRVLSDSQFNGFKYFQKTGVVGIRGICLFVINKFS
jgi:hypothetical protein